MCPRNGRDGCGKSRHHRDSILGPSNQYAFFKGLCKCIAFVNGKDIDPIRAREGLVVFHCNYIYYCQTFSEFGTVKPLFPEFNSLNGSLQTKSKHYPAAMHIFI
jgi:hypothetical protein